MGGYWLHLSDDSGEHWRGPFYMGFAHQYPYDVASQSRAPAFDGDRLQLEVERREVDEKTITFPPVGLRAKNVRKDVDKGSLTRVGSVSEGFRHGVSSPRRI